MFITVTANNMCIVQKCLEETNPKCQHWLSLGGRMYVFLCLKKYIFSKDYTLKLLQEHFVILRSDYIEESLRARHIN